MTCKLFDVGCMVGNALAPLQAFWASWWPLGLFVLGLIVGGILGWRVVLGVLTVGFGFFLYDRFKPISEPIETELPKRDKVPAPRKPIKADNSIVEDFMNRLGKKR